MKCYYEDGSEVTLGQEKGSGGEGTVYELDDDDSLVAKLFTKADIEKLSAKKEKLEKLCNRLDKETFYPYATWPIDFVYDDKDEFIGYTMHKVPENYTEIYDLLSPKNRKREFPGKSYKFLVEVAINFAKVIHFMHKRGIIVGDIQPQNIYVNEMADVKLIDCDSFQIKGSTTEVGVAEYVAPEIRNSGKSYGEILREPNSDVFPMAVIIFKILFMGTSPFMVEDGEQDCKQGHNYIFDDRPSNKYKQNVNPDIQEVFDALDDKLKDYFQRTFAGISDYNRPDVESWIRKLEKMKSHLVQCPKSSNTHFYNEKLNECIWCRLANRNGGYDYF